MSSTAAGNLGSGLPSIIMSNGGSGGGAMRSKLDVKGPPGTALTGKLFGGEKHESWQMELLMERLRGKAKSAHYKSFPEMSKSVRMSLLEKRYALDAVEKSNLQKTLDSMQYCIKVTSRQGLVERLDCLTRQLGLKLSEDTSGLFISSDMFYLEIILDPNGMVQDVKVHHECKMKQQSCSELVSCLQRGDFVDFTMQLEGLASIYQLNAEKKIKVNAFVALQALETDLYTIYMLSMQHFSDVNALLLKSPLGVVQKRRGGHAMKLTYFVAPYELLDQATKSMKRLSAELIATEKIGSSVAVNLEGSTANKLQVQPLLTVQPGSSPVYSPIDKHNSTSLPATFVLRLNKPMPINYAMMRKIKSITSELQPGANASDAAGSGMEPVAGDPTPLIGLIVQHSSSGMVNSIAKGLFVTLPDQYHCYYMSETRNMQGVMVSSIPFTEPQHVPKILAFLRQQAVFNQLLASCIRNGGSSNTRLDHDGLLVFEVSALSCQYILVSLMHPFNESLATVELDLQNIASIKARIFCGGVESDEHIAGRVSAALQRSMSIPVTMRTLIKEWDEEQELKFKPSIGVGGSGANGGTGNSSGPVENNGGGSGGGTGGTGGEGNFSLTLGPDDGGGTTSGPGGEVGLNGHGTGGGQPAGSTFCDMKNPNPPEPGTGGTSDAVSAKKRRTTEDFCRSPKSNSNSSNNDSNKPPTEMEVDGPEVPNVDDGGGANGAEGLPTTAPADPEDDEEMEEEEAEEEEEEYDESTNLSSADSSNSLGGNQGNTSGNSNSGMVSAIGSTGTSSLMSGGGGSGAGGGTGNTVGTDGGTGGAASGSTSDKHESSGNSSSLLENLDFSNLDPDLMRSSNSSDLDDTAEIVDNDMNDFFGRKSAVKQGSNILGRDERGMHSVSITPIGVNKAGNNASSGSGNFVLGLDKRSGIEIIPLAGNSSAGISSSVTITPIPMSQSNAAPVVSGGSSGSSKKSSTSTGGSGNSSGSSKKNSDSDRSKLEKKKKRKTDDQPAMGPPNKIPSKSGGESSPVHGKSSSGGNKSSPKHSPVNHNSPKHGNMGLPSPKHGTSSPKHHSGSSGGGKPSMSALKSAANSPSSKSSSSGGKDPDGSGGTGGSTSKSGNGNSGTTGSSSSKDRDKERSEKKALHFPSTGPPSTSGPVSVSSSTVPKAKHPTTKQKQRDLSNSGALGSIQLELLSGSGANLVAALGPGTIDLTDSVGCTGAGSAGSGNSASGGAMSTNMLLLQAAKNRKGSLSAVIDKLKSAQTGDESMLLLPEMTSATATSGYALNTNVVSKDMGTTVKLLPPPLSPQNSPSTSISSLPSSTTAATTVTVSAVNTAATGKNSEYMVKPSSDGIKLTIQNKKGTKGGNISKGSSKSGLKPGVSSGPVSSKKTLQSSSSFSGAFPSSTAKAASTGGLASSGGTSKLPFQKSNSFGSLGTGTVKSSKVSSPKSMSNPGNTSSSSSSKDKSRSSSGSGAGKSSLLGSSGLSQSVVNPISVMKMLGFPTSMHNMEGFVKTLDTKFQIPKLSARVPAGDTTVQPTEATPNKVKETERKQPPQPATSPAPNTPLPQTSPSELRVPSPMLMLPNVMQKMFPHDNLMLQKSHSSDGMTFGRSSPGIATSGNSRDGFTFGSKMSAPNTPTTVVMPPFPSPQPGLMDFSNDSTDMSSLMRPPSRPSSTISNHSHSPQDNLKQLMDSLPVGMLENSLLGPPTSVTLSTTIDNTQQQQQLVAVLKTTLPPPHNHPHHHVHHVGQLKSPASVSVHIVKSPAPSPLPFPSPHSNSSAHGIDDDLMDDALVGIGGK